MYDILNVAWSAHVDHLPSQMLRILVGRHSSRSSGGKQHLSMPHGISQLKQGQLPVVLAKQAYLSVLVLNQLALEHAQPHQGQSTASQQHKRHPS